MRPMGTDSSALSFIESLGDACLVVDDGLAVAASNQAADTLYRPGKPLVGSSVLDWCPAAGVDEFISRIGSCNGHPASFSMTQVRGDGSTFDAEITAATCHHHSSPGVTLIVREKPSRPAQCQDDLAIRNVALDNALDGIVVHTIDGMLLFANRAALSQWGNADLEALKAAGPFPWVPEPARDHIRKRVATLTAHGEARFDTPGTSPSGDPLNIEVHSRLIPTDRGPVVVATARDVTERIQTEEMVRYLAYHDMLTGLANRVKLGQELSHEVAAAGRYGDLLGVIFIDLNDFKPVNDTYGHTIGDHVLREVADRIAGNVRESDTVARLGGDEFVVVLPRLSEPEDLQIVADKLSAEISRPIRAGRQEIRVSATLGTALHEPGEDADSLLIRADLAMYDARDRRIVDAEHAEA